MYDPLEGPIEFQLLYVLPDEFEAEEFKCDYTNKRWYIPAAAHPHFNMNFYKGMLTGKKNPEKCFIKRVVWFIIGTTRRIQYTFNNTDPDGYFPPPCMVDWPYGTFDGTVSWQIGHCPNIVSPLRNVFRWFSILYMLYLHVCCTCTVQICRMIPFSILPSVS